MVIVIVNSGLNVLDCFVYSGLKVLDYCFWIECTGLLCQGSCGCLLMDSVWSIMDYGVTLGHCPSWIVRPCCLDLRGCLILDSVWTIMVFGSSGLVPISGL